MPSWAGAVAGLSGVSVGGTGSLAGGDSAALPRCWLSIWRSTLPLSPGVTLVTRPVSGPGFLLRPDPSQWVCEHRRQRAEERWGGLPQVPRGLGAATTCLLRRSCRCSGSPSCAEDPETGFAGCVIRQRGTLRHCHGHTLAVAAPKPRLGAFEVGWCADSRDGGAVARWAGGGVCGACVRGAAGWVWYFTPPNAVDVSAGTLPRRCAPGAAEIEVRAARK